MASLPPVPPRARARVALVFDYPSRWAARALPQGQSYHPAHTALDWYSAASRLGVNLDIIGQRSDLLGYDLILAPDLLIPDPAFVDRLRAAPARVLFGPRSGSKTPDMHIPATLPPGPLSALIDIAVTRVESLPDYHRETVRFGNQTHTARAWRETVVTSEPVLAHFQGPYRDNAPALIGNDKARYLATLRSPEFLLQIMTQTLAWAGVPTLPDLGDVRLSRRGALCFAFNYGPTPADLPAPADAQFLLGSRRLAPADVAVWSEP